MKDDLLDLADGVDDALWWLDATCHQAARMLLEADDRWPDLELAAANLEDVRERLAVVLEPLAGAIGTERTKRTNAGPLPTLGGRIPRRD